MKKLKLFLITYALIHLYTNTLFAEDCLEFKISPSVKITVPEYTKKITQPDEELDKMHGNVVATFEESYELSAASAPFGAGYCVVLKGVNANIGYTDFLVKIDKSNIPDSCEYNMVAKHEQKHIDAYLSALDDGKKDISTSISNAADSVMPVFVKSLDGVNAALDKMQSELQTNPNIVLIRQKIDAETELRNKKIDTSGDALRMLKCK